MERLMARSKGQERQKWRYSGPDFGEWGPLPSGGRPHSDKHLTGLRPDRGGRNWLRVFLMNE